MEINRNYNFYEKYTKRILDIIFSILILLFGGWLYVIIALLVWLKLGRPIVFIQPRPGMIDPKTGKEKIFDMYKFRTMSDKKNDLGELLPPEKRLNSFGKTLRATSLDELLEVFNIIKGDMSLIGPRPQLVQDMVFMNEKQRMRHTVRPGLSGLAQIKGRNAITWEEKFNLDLKYIENISFTNDLKILALTVKKVFGNKESAKELDLTDDFGDSLLKTGIISLEEYNLKLLNAKKILEQRK